MDWLPYHIAAFLDLAICYAFWIFIMCYYYLCSPVPYTYIILLAIGFRLYVEHSYNLVS